MKEPNDILIRITRNEDGSYSKDVAIAINDEAMLPEMERTAKVIRDVVTLIGTDGGLRALRTALRAVDAEGLARPSPHIKLLDS